MQAEIAALKEKISALEGDLAIAKACQVNWYPGALTAGTNTTTGTIWYPGTWQYQFPSGGSV